MARKRYRKSNKLEIDNGQETLMDKIENGFLKSSIESKSKQVAEYNKSFSDDIIQPSFDIMEMAYFRHNNVWHARAINTVSTVSAGSGWIIRGKDKKTLTDARKEEVKNFLTEATKNGDTHSGFSEFMTCLCKDIRNIGSYSFEVVRDVSGKPLHFYHVPAVTVRKRAGKDDNENRNYGYYQIVHQQYNMGLNDENGRNFMHLQVADSCFSSGVAYKKVFFKEYGDKRKFDLKGKQKSNISPEQEAGEIFQKREYDGTSPHYGVPEWLPALIKILCDEAGSQWNLQFFKKHRIPNFLIQLLGRNMKPEEKKEFKEYFTNHADNNVPLLISGGQGEIKIQRLSDVQNEGDFLKQGEAMKEAIFAAHGVPMSVIGIETSGKIGAVNSGSQQRKNFKQLTINPVQEKLVDPFNNFILPEAGFGDCELVLTEFDDSDAEEYAKKSQTCRENVKVGIMTYNESRKKLGLEEINAEWANKHFLVLGNNLIDLANQQQVESLTDNAAADADLDNSTSKIKHELNRIA